MTVNHILTPLLLAVLGGCVREDVLPCPPSDDVPTGEALVVRAIDIVTGEDITSSGSVRDATLMFFDGNDRFVARLDVPGEKIGREIAMPAELLARAAGDKLRISSWGNIESNISFQEGIGTGHKITDQFLGLRVNTEYLDNWYNPGDVFFGMNEITIGEDPATRADGVGERVVHTVTVTQKTARMAVSVRGLPAGTSAADYYFSMCEQNDGFAFDGTPMRNNQWCKIREEGVFNVWGDLVTDQPYYVIHSIDPNDVSGCNAGVCLYKVGGGFGSRATRALTSDQAGYITADGDMNLTGKAKQDVDGSHLALHPGQTTNVLISFTPGGSLEVRVEMTDWNKTYQWGLW